MMDEFEELMLERRKMLEEALERAESGLATVEDWWLIRAECGLPQNQHQEFV